MGASSRSPSPITMVPSMSTDSISLRMASTATWSAYLRSPWPMVRAAAMAPRSTTLTNSRKRSSRCIFYLRGGTLLTISKAVGSPPETPRRASPRLRSATALTGWLWSPIFSLSLVCRQLDAPRLVLADAEGVVGLHDLVDLAGAFVDDGGLAVPVIAADGVF